MDDKTRKVLIKGLDKWLRLSCYIACLYWLVGMLPYLPRELADKIVALLLSKIGL